ncbi:MAG: J domain-containing protein [Hyperionvirus sp.]|uniref:J domain-containing protein n=1 Tax=Hyperionvirus sp. TaxID=2487770 RepID=A0A3G5A6X6_9VIRU|nr:MAG: J domain-containing protein [Hyperionvirus sp.]
MVKDYYEILNVRENVTLADIQTAFKNLATQWHPDRFPDAGKPVALEKFKEICEAYEILSNQEKRENYNKRKRNLICKVLTYSFGIAVLGMSLYLFSMSVA